MLLVFISSYDNPDLKPSLHPDHHIGAWLVLSAKLRSPEDAWEDLLQGGSNNSHLSAPDFYPCHTICSGPSHLTQALSVPKAQDKTRISHSCCQRVIRTRKRKLKEGSRLHHPLGCEHTGTWGLKLLTQTVSACRGPGSSLPLWEVFIVFTSQHWAIKRWLGESEILVKILHLKK